ncbi:MAG: hypothetical protein A2Z91_00050 [Deltaproteobacteria bacterium GWA2_38_16]|nr:MAG: hypothetical protein A2Z91_00050 [Deltaproteobacteria bacterium GWA2_38_16]OGQ03498.1 MAG: hypothetical protein A3D19_01455 [Deltaproteobacteria bacterium RIFCSPHIGHO2_02_FULL_38_15]OGQ30378.1 MAG: hypothetical protein A3A72_01675 [Deltaproteobacteria bacterium RIFCSPLOWO2_01_FULL_38_9]HBQ21267.1 hypothetical protein [Deltaproteobacteria bacterium]
MKKVILTIAMVVGFLTPVWAGNEFFDLPLNVHGKKAKIIYDKLSLRDDVERVELSAEQMGEPFHTSRLRLKEKEIMCFQIRDTKSRVPDYDCIVHIDIDVLLQILGLEE